MELLKPFTYRDMENEFEELIWLSFNKYTSRGNKGAAVDRCGRDGVQLIGCKQTPSDADRSIPSNEVSIYLGVSTEALKPRSSNLPVRLKLLSSYPRPSTRAGVFWTLVDRSLLAVEFQTPGPVTELAGQIQAMHNNRSPRKLWRWMVSGWIKQQGGST